MKSGGSLEIYGMAPFLQRLCFWTTASILDGGSDDRGKMLCKTLTSLLDEILQPVSPQLFLVQQDSR